MIKVFRAKPKNWKELPGEDRWIEGLPVYVKGKMCMIEDYKDTGDTADLEMEQDVPKMSFTEIDIKTLCRAMELTDANGRQIWEHDMIQHVESDTIGEVIWGQEEYVGWYVDDVMIDIQQFTTEMWQESVIVGNVFDNPEMVKRVTFNHAWRTYMESKDEICSFTNAMYNIGFFNGTMKSLDAKKGETKAAKTAAAETKTEEKVAEKIDFSNVKIEPLFEEMVDFDTFSKSDFRAVKIKDCVAVPKSKKLLQFTLDDGTGTDRTILSGIHEYYEPEELIGKTAIAIVNLPPRKMMGIDSCGMLISAVHEEDGREGLNLLMVDDRIPAGAKLY